MAQDKITGSDLFGNDVGKYFQQFKDYAKESADEIKRLRQEVKKLNDAMIKGEGMVKNQKKINKLLKDYNKQLRKTNQLQNQRLLSSRKLTRAQKQLERSNMRLTGSLKGMFGSIRSLLGAAGFAGLTVTLFQAGRSIFNYTKQLQSLDLALEKITDSTYQFAESKRFLVEMSDRLGLNLIKTAKSYTTFRAAAKQSNLTLMDTNEIFESFADVGANLALTSSEMGSIFLALEQMLSKGKVSTEELRRQLGEKLPGAMGIMAEALGVTTGELDKMLRKGEVLTEDALPKFAAKVREVYGVDMNKSVNTLQASVNRLTNAWIRFIELINNDGEGVGAVFVGALDTLTMIVEQAEILADILGEKGPGSWQNVMTEAFSETWEFTKMITDGVLRFSAVLGDFFSFGAFNILDRYETLTDAASGEIELPDGSGFTDELEERRRAIEQRKQRRERAQSIEELQRVTVLLNESFGEQIVQQLEVWELDKLTTEQIKEKINFIEKQTLSIKKQRKEIEEAEKEAEANRKRIADKYGDQDPVNLAGLPTADEVKLMYTQIDLILKKAITDLEANAEQLREQVFLFPDDMKARAELAKIEKEIVDFYTRLGTVSKPSGDDLAFYAQGMNRRNGVDTFESADPDSTIVNAEAAESAERWANRLTYARDVLTEVWELENAVFEDRMRRLQEEDEAMTEKYERLARLAEGDADMQKRLRIRQEEDEEKLEQKRKKLAYDRAKAEKRQALVDIAINTAIAVSKVWAQTGVFALAAQAPVIAMGIIQAAIVASQPLPEYAEGTDFHPGGPAVVGDGGKEEIVFTPDGKTYLTQATPHVVDMPKGSRVIADAQEYIQNETIKAVIQADRRMDELVVDKVAQAVRKGFAGTNINSKTNVNVSIGHELWRRNLIN